MRDGSPKALATDSTVFPSDSVLTQCPVMMSSHFCAKQYGKDEANVGMNQIILTLVMPDDEPRVTQRSAPSAPSLAKTDYCTSSPHAGSEVAGVCEAE